MTREDFRRWERPPFLLPKTTQDEYYSMALIEMNTIKCKGQILWDSVKDLRFWDGSIAGFIEDPVKNIILRAKQTITVIYNTMRKLKYYINCLNAKATHKPHNH